ncbi:MAG: translational GTPase TypA [SAR324 cluster bacterium]|nr:translational GTPase TypA [SAR324 cluster bacterium]
MASPPPERIRNIAIIAHVDHGKTTLVDHLLRQSGSFRKNEAVQERYMDSMDLERERGITIAAKNASFTYKGIKVNIVDTPGHSDFGGEVERVLDMVDGAILLVDASEGPLPQTRFVLKKALEQNLKIIVCINKIDRPDARVNEVLDDLFGLFIDLDATDEQADFDTIYTVAREGRATADPAQLGDSLDLLFQWIVEKFPPPRADARGPLQMLVANIDYNDYVGRLAVGRIRAGGLRVGDELLVAQVDGERRQRVSALFSYQAGRQVPVEALAAGDIAVVAGFEQIQIGDTLMAPHDPRPLPRIAVDEPTVGIMISGNDGPFAGRESKKITGRNIKERLDRELLHNVAIRVEDTPIHDTWKVVGRGELQLGIRLEQMRREGFELVVSKPQVMFKEEQGRTLEPMELVVVDVEETYMGAVAKKLGARKGVMTKLANRGSGRVRQEFRVPARGLIGYRSEFLTDTRGTGILNTQFDGYDSFKGEMGRRTTGALVADRKGRATAYSLFNLEDRGRLFITPNTEVYEGMIVGENNKGSDLNVNVAREKKLTNIRASGSDEAVRLSPIKPMTLEAAMEWITGDELIEITPAHIRIRCRQLDPHKRKTKPPAAS